MDTIFEKESEELVNITLTPEQNFFNTNTHLLEEKKELSRIFSEKICNSENKTILHLMMEEQKKFIQASEILKSINLESISSPLFMFSEQGRNAIMDILDFYNIFSSVPAVSEVISGTSYQVQSLLSEQKEVNTPTSFNDLGNIVSLPKEDKLFKTSNSFTAENLVLPEPMKKGEKRNKDDKGYYEKWADRENKEETPSKFLERVWGKYIKAGLLYQADLRGWRDDKTPKKGLDKTLFDRLFDECKDNLGCILPNKTAQVKKRVSSISSIPQKELREKRRALGYYKSTSRRSTSKN